MQTGDMCGNAHRDQFNVTNALGYQELERETCDDGNRIDGDGCDAYCHVDNGWTCATDGQPCTPTCGDRAVVGDEVCDPDVPYDKVYCRQCKEVVPGYCSDAVVQTGFEGCDDGNVAPFDGCSESCAVNFGFRCTGSPSKCTASGLASDLHVDRLTPAEKATFCGWLVSSLGGAGAVQFCSTSAVKLVTLSVEDCNRAIWSESTPVGEIEELFAKGGSTCGLWDHVFHDARLVVASVLSCHEELTGTGGCVSVL